MLHAVTLDVACRAFFSDLPGGNRSAFTNEDVHVRWKKQGRETYFKERFHSYIQDTIILQDTSQFSVFFMPSTLICNLFNKRQ